MAGKVRANSIMLPYEISVKKTEGRRARTRERKRKEIEKKKKKKERESERVSE